MKITKQRLRQIIKEELASLEEGVYSWGGKQRAKPKYQGDYSKRADARGEPAPSKERPVEKNRFVDQRQFQDRYYDYDRDEWVSNVKEEIEEGADPIHKIVSRDGKKKGVKVSGNWKDPKIKVKWIDAEGKFGKEVSVDTRDYTRKKW